MASFHRGERIAFGSWVSAWNHAIGIRAGSNGLAAFKTARGHCEVPLVYPAMQQQHKAEMDAILRRFYGPRSERFDPTQLLLFGLAVAEELPVDPKAVLAETGQKLTTRRINHHRHGRQQLPAHLPRIEILHDLTEGQKKCPCCGEARQVIGSEVSEQLEFVTASFQVLKHIRHKYACKACSDGCCKCDGGKGQGATADYGNTRPSRPSTRATPAKLGQQSAVARLRWPPRQLPNNGLGRLLRYPIRGLIGCSLALRPACSQVAL